MFLTAAHPKQTVGSDVYCGTSIDQMYAQKYGQDTPVPSIQLTTENAGRIRQLRMDVQLLVHEHDQLVVAHDPSADDSEPAAGV